MSSIWVDARPTTGHFIAGTQLMVRPSSMVQPTFDSNGSSVGTSQITGWLVQRSGFAGRTDILPGVEVSAHDCMALGGYVWQCGVGGIAGSVELPDPQPSDINVLSASDGNLQWNVIGPAAVMMPITQNFGLGGYQ